jgi:hypothetical protein
MRQMMRSWQPIADTGEYIGQIVIEYCRFLEFKTFAHVDRVAEQQFVEYWK